jgi:hypothetical protein
MFSAKLVALICPRLVHSEFASETQEGMNTDAYTESS